MASLVGRLLRQRVLESLALSKASDEKRGDHRNAEAQIGQGELRQQRDCPLAGLAEIAPDTDGAVKVGADVCERSVVETVRRQRLFGLALRALARASLIEVGQLVAILLHGTGERV